MRNQTESSQGMLGRSCVPGALARAGAEQRGAQMGSRKEGQQVGLQVAGEGDRERCFPKVASIQCLAMRIQIKTLMNLRGWNKEISHHRALS